MNALYMKVCELEFPVNMGANNVIIVLPSRIPAKILEWKVSVGNVLSVGRVILLYDINSSKGNPEPKKFKASQVGTVVKLLAAEGDIIKPGEPLLELEKCCHPTVMKDMCAECGADLRMDNYELPNASVPMVHSVPELKVSIEQAQVIGRADEVRLLKQRKLVLLVDLDQTLIHTTNDDILPNLKDVHHFQLHGAGSPWYHTRLRPGTYKFLENMSHLYELHICTFGSRTYAHAIAAILDYSGKIFSHRILSRDECFNPNTKTANLKALFPCGDNLVCIIDDREDVWNHAPNLVHVRPYHFFQHTGDINAPPPISTSCDPSLMDKSYVSSNLENQTNQSQTEFKEIEKTDIKKEESIEIAGSQSVSQNECSEEAVCSTEKQTDVRINNDIPNDADIRHDVEGQVFQKNCRFKDEGGGDNLEKNELIEKDFEVLPEKEPETVKAETEVTSDLEKESVSQIEKQRTVDAERKISKKSEEKEEVLLELDDHDDYLLHLEDILGTIHRAFYQIYDQSHPDIPDMKNVVPYVRRKVLQGVRICFSGVVPIGVPLEASRVYAVARSLGAEVTNELVLEGESCSWIDAEDSKGESVIIEEETSKEEFQEIYDNNDENPKTCTSSFVNKNDVPKSKKTATHLVAARLGTYKVNQAKRVKGSSLLVVTPEWLWCCAERWERVDERLFPLNKSTSADCTKKSKNVYSERQTRFRDTEETNRGDNGRSIIQEQDSSSQGTKSSSPHTANNSGLNDNKPVSVPVFATYDPVTGKRVIKAAAVITLPTTEANDCRVATTTAEERRRTPSGRFMDTINPLLSFSSEDLANMEDEVEEGLFDEEEDETESEVEGVRQEDGLDFDSRQSDQMEEIEVNHLSKEGTNNRKRKSSSISSSEEKQMVGEGVKSITKHFSREGQLREWDYDESVEMEDAEEDEDDDKDWSMMGAALEREIMAEELE